MSKQLESLYRYTSRHIGTFAYRYVPVCLETGVLCFCLLGKSMKRVAVFGRGGECGAADPFERIGMQTDSSFQRRKLFVSIGECAWGSAVVWLEGWT